MTLPLPQQHPTVAPQLSTSDTHIFEDPTPPVKAALPGLDDEQLYITYEIERTVAEIRAGRWKRIALQFPDDMLGDAPRVYEGLRRALRREREAAAEHKVQDEASLPAGKSIESEGIEDLADKVTEMKLQSTVGGAFQDKPDTKLFILGDTSYGACCVDEIAAEHADAEVVVHYGRSCLSPTARLPVIYVYTTRPLDLQNVVVTFKNTYPDKEQKVVVMADIPYAGHIPQIEDILKKDGFTEVYATELIHNPSSPLPNRTIPPDVVKDSTRLQAYNIFHISDPPTALLLTLSSRAGAIHIYSTEPGASRPDSAVSPVTTTRMALRRRYALLTSLTTTPILGILINTLSVKNYMHVVDRVKEMIAAADKKSYTFVVGKINAAKLANFSEIGGWVVVGCWESSLVESKEFYRPVITPWELELALKGDGERLWTGEWRSDFKSILEERRDQSDMTKSTVISTESVTEPERGSEAGDEGDLDDEEESEPPEFDLRTGRYVSHSRPMRSAKVQTQAGTEEESQKSQALIKRANGDIVHVGGVASPGAEYLREKRTWQGLGSDFDTSYSPDEERRPDARVEEGRKGVARGYTVGSNGNRA